MSRLAENGFKNDKTVMSYLHIKGRTSVKNNFAKKAFKTDRSVILYLHTKGRKFVKYIILHSMMVKINHGIARNQTLVRNYN